MNNLDVFDSFLLEAEQSKDQETITAIHSRIRDFMTKNERRIGLQLKFQKQYELLQKQLKQLQNGYEVILQSNLGDSISFVRGGHLYSGELIKILSNSVILCVDGRNRKVAWSKLIKGGLNDESFQSV